MAASLPLPRDVMRRALHFQRPPRLPVRVHSLGVNDCGIAWLLPSREFRDRPRPEGVDEWGCTWAHTDVHNMGQVVCHPLEDLRGLDRYPMPDYTDSTRYEGWEESLASCDEAGLYIVSGFMMVLFERMHSLHGFERTLLDLYADRPAMEALADRIVEVHLTAVNEMGRRFPGRLHGIGITDDWGTQQNGFVSYDFWMDFFHPRYKRIFDAIHAIGCDVWLHSCGHINDLIEGYIQSGVDIVNIHQPRALGIEAIGQRYAGRIAFDSLADIQATLPTGDRARVARDIEQLMRHWATQEGGFVFSEYGDDAAIGNDPALNAFMYEQFSEWSERLYGNPLPSLPVLA